MDKVYLATYHILGTACPWYYMLKRDSAMASWECFKELCNQHFRPPEQKPPAHLQFWTAM